MFLDICNVQLIIMCAVNHYKQRWGADTSTVVSFIFTVDFIALQPPEFPFFKGLAWFDGLIDTILCVMADLGLYSFN